MFDSLIAAIQCYGVILKHASNGKQLVYELHDTVGCSLPLAHDLRLPSRANTGF